MNCLRKWAEVRFSLCYNREHGTATASNHPHGDIFPCVSRGTLLRHMDRFAAERQHDIGRRWPDLNRDGGKRRAGTTAGFVLDVVIYRVYLASYRGCIFGGDCSPN